MVPERMVEPGVINVCVANTRECRTVQPVDWDENTYHYITCHEKREGWTGRKVYEHSLAVKNMQNELKSKAELLIFEVK